MPGRASRGGAPTAGTADDAGPEHVQEFYRAEFAALRAEIDRRSNAQQGLMVLYVTGIGVAVTVASRTPPATDTGTVTSQSFAALALLVLPFTSLALATLFLDHHYKIGEIGQYIAETCTHRIGLTEHWEAWNRRTQGRRGGSSWWAGPFLIFACSALAALAGTAPLLLVLDGSPLVWCLRVLWGIGLIAAVMTVAVLVQAWRAGAAERRARVRVRRVEVADADQP